MQPLPSFIPPLQKQPSQNPLRISRGSLNWWVEINTSVPLCTYYFGPFDNQTEARDSRTGYVDDLHQEGARGIIALIKHCHPQHLTIEQGHFSIRTGE